MPVFRASVTAVMNVIDGDENRDRWLENLRIWAGEEGFERTLMVEARDGAHRCVVSEVFELEAPSLDDAERMAKRAFGARAFDASLPPGPSAFDVELSAVSREGRDLKSG